VQAAERFVREETGLTGISDVTVESVARRNGSWSVSIVAEGRTHAVEVTQEVGDLTLLTCHSQVARRPRRFVARRA